MLVGVAVFVNVAVGGTGVFVDVGVFVLVGVAVGGTAVFVEVGVLVFVGVAVGVGNSLIVTSTSQSLKSWSPPPYKSSHMILTTVEDS